MDDIAPLLFVFVLTWVLIIFILLLENRRARVWLVDVDEEHKNRQKVVPKRKKAACVVVLV